MPITVNDIKKLSPKAKAAIIVAVIVVVGYFDWFYFLSGAMEKKTSLKTKLDEVQSQIADKERIARQFNKYKADVAALRESYKIALQKLPDQREIPGLFHSVSQAGRDAGIEFLLFEPKAAIPKGMAKEQPKASSLLKPSDQRQADQKPAPGADSKKAPAPPKEPEPFYEEIPVNVTVVGTFPNTVYFFEKVAKLPRIVNIADVTMGERKETKGKRGFSITTSCTIKTYMFVDKKASATGKTK